MKKIFQNKYIPLLLIILLIWWAAMLTILLKKDSGTKNISPVSKSFIQSLPQLANIDTAKEVCFEMTTGTLGQSSIDCFTPNDFETHTKNIEDIGTYKSALQKSTVINARPVENSKKSEFLQFYDLIQPSMSAIEKGKYLSLRKDVADRVSSSSWVTAGILQNYTYLLSLEGKYKEAQKERDNLCSRFPDACDKNLVSFGISGTVSTDKGLPVENATIRVLWNTGKTTTDREGKYLLEFQSFPGQKIRIEAFKPGFSNANFWQDILSWVAKQNYTKDFTLNTPVQFAVINTVKNTISGENTGIEGKNFTIKTAWSDYRIPFWSLVHKDGKTFKGKVTAYFFEFNKQSHNEDLLQNDIFDEVVGYAGNLMKTFGMPYVLFVADDTERIHILKSDPILLQNKLQEMEALRTNKDHVYSPVTNEDMQFLIQKSKELGGYPIDREFLIQNNMLRFPLWWIFDQSKGIWAGHPMRVVSEEGIVESTFYTISEIEK